MRIAQRDSSSAIAPSKATERTGGDDRAKLRARARPRQPEKEGREGRAFRSRLRPSSPSIEFSKRAIVATCYLLFPLRRFFRIAPPARRRWRISAVRRDATRSNLFKITQNRRIRQSDHSFSRRKTFIPEEEYPRSQEKKKKKLFTTRNAIEKCSGRH